MHHTSALTKCTMARYFPQMPGRKPKGNTGPHHNRILALRLERGLTQAQLGDKVGKEGPYVAKLEKGLHKLSEEMLEKLCDALKCDPWEIAPRRFRLSDEDVEALLINRGLQQGDPERRARWVASGNDALSAIGKS